MTYWSLFTFIAGLVIGHFGAMRRTRLSEFNSIASRLSITLNQYRNNITAYNRPSETDFTAILRYMPRLSANKFKSAVDVYKSAHDKTHQTQDAHGQVSLHNTAEIKAAIDHLLNLLEWRWW